MFKFPIQLKIVFALIVISFAFVSTLKADYLKANSNYCITDDWYFQYKESASKNALYYYQSKTPTTLRSTTGTRQEQYLISGYEYNTTTGICRKNLNLMGLTQEDYNAYMAFTGLISALIITSTVIVILKV